eukprot:SM000160S02526  [mRNA]  locus=s160:53697:57514:- [translate_table: standard]
MCPERPWLGNGCLITAAAVKTAEAAPPPPPPPLPPPQPQRGPASEGGGELLARELGELRRLLSRQRRALATVVELEAQVEQQARRISDLRDVAAHVDVHDRGLRLVEEEEDKEEDEDEGEGDKGEEEGGGEEGRRQRQRGRRSRAAALAALRRDAAEWEERFELLAAVRVDGGAEVSALLLLPNKAPGVSGGSGECHVVVADDRGRLHVFDATLDGDGGSAGGSSRAALLEAPLPSPATALLAFHVRSECVLVTGHADGSARVYRLHDTFPAKTATGHAAAATPQLAIELLHVLVDAPAANEAPLPPVAGLELFRAGHARFILVLDGGGRILAFRGNGTLHGAASAPARPLAFLRGPTTHRASATRPVFLTEAGAGSLDLRDMVMKGTGCQGLGGSRVAAYVFDVAGRSKAYGLTHDGELVYVSLSGDTQHFDCRVRERLDVGLTGPAVSLQGLRGYLVAATPDVVTVYNTTTATASSKPERQLAAGGGSGVGDGGGGAGGLRLLFRARARSIQALFIRGRVPANSRLVMVSDREQLLILAFSGTKPGMRWGSGGHVAIFRSTLPVLRAPEFTAKFWSSPLLVAVLVLVGAWQIFGQKRADGAAGSPDANAADGDLTPPLLRGGRDGLASSTSFGHFDQLRSLSGSSSFRAPTSDAGTGGRPYAVAHGDGDGRDALRMGYPASRLSRATPA